MLVQYAVDPLIVIDAPWPDGRYSLIQATSGCPTGWSSGFVKQDFGTDLFDNVFRWQHVIPLYDAFVRTYFAQHGIALGPLQDYFKFEFDPNWHVVDTLTTYYCTKTVQGATGYQWPAGHYCIARYGGSCPDGFFEGSITWDDEDSNNKNSRHPPYPDGDYGSTNTQIYFCCRSDGNADHEIYLPPTQPFGLYRYGGKCLSVKGMNVIDFSMIYGINNSGDSCSGKHPDDKYCRGPHHLNLCYYDGQ